MAQAPRPSADADALRLHVDDLSSDDEAGGLTIGDVPREWYDDYDHLGYKLDGKKAAKPKRKDGIDRFIASREDPNFRWTVFDEETGQDVVLSRREIEIIRQIHTGKYPHPEFNAEPDHIDYFTSKPEIHPMSAAPEPKRRFLPSKWEKMKIMKYYKQIKEGRYKRGPPPPPPESFLLWGEDDKAIDYDPRKKGPVHIPAPKLKPPGHNASYNPPPEFLMTDAEEKRWASLHPEDRPLPFIPRKFAALRHVPLYKDGIRERYDRCLDLYLAPRALKKKLNIDPDSLLPTLPDPKDLRPFPTTLMVQYRGHTGRVRCVSVSPSGEWLATGSDDKTVRVWEVETGRQMHVFELDGTVQQVAWNPNPALHVLAAVVDTKMLLINPGLAGPATCTASLELLRPEKLTGRRRVVVADDTVEDGEELDVSVVSKKKEWATWEWTAPIPAEDITPADLPTNPGVFLEVIHKAHLKRVVWHRKGDYVSTVSPTASTAHVLVHQVSRRMTQNPFKQSHGRPQTVVFHPSKPVLFIANQRTIRVYNLIEEKLIKKLTSGLKYISSIDVHPTGEHLLVGSYDCRVAWFDVELASTPFKTLKYHDKAVRRVAFHPHYPLMASASDDGKVHIFHARVFDDFLQNPMIVPVRILKAHTVTSEDLGTLDCVWHPTQPWVFTSGADRSVCLFQNIP